MNKKLLIGGSIAAGIVAAAAAGGWYYAQTQAPHRHRLERVETPQGRTYWTCVMHPELRRDRPGQCPICGMALVERTETPPPVTTGSASGATDAEPGFIQVDPRMQQSLGMRTARVARGGTDLRLEAVGRVALDESRLVAVVSRTPGFVERLGVHSVGEAVRRGQFVAGVYSPELFAAQQEFALIARGDAALAPAARRRLALLGLPQAQVEALARGGRPQRQAPLVAPASGVITELNAREGMETTPGVPVARIADLSTVWLLTDVPESRGAVAAGTPVRAEFNALPGEHFDGRVDYVYPALDEATRNLRLRIVLDNPQLRLRPGMLARVRIGDGSAPADGGSLQLPADAVIRTGGRDVVILAEGEGRFRPVRVRLGRDHGDRIEILEGLDEDALVVTSGQFLLDSEASLRGLLGDEPAAPSHEHSARPGAQR